MMETCESLIERCVKQHETLVRVVSVCFKVISVNGKLYKNLDKAKRPFPIDLPESLDGMLQRHKE